MFVRRILLLAASVALAAPLQANANYACAGTVGYLGMDGTGNLTLALSGSTPIHAICNVNAQDGWGFTVGACKAVYASLLAARLTGKGVTGLLPRERIDVLHPAELGSRTGVSH